VGPQEIQLAIPIINKWVGPIKADEVYELLGTTTYDAFTEWAITQSLNVIDESESSGSDFNAISDTEADILSENHLQDEIEILDQNITISYDNKIT
jgi:hypothetical protein